jgi:hypothetical protein
MKIIHGNNEVDLPDFLLAGSAKCGTTTIFQYLQRQSSVFLPELKEPFYFSFGNEKPTYTDARFNSKVIWKTEEYIALFKNAKTSQLIGDASTSYLYTAEKTIQNVKSLYKEKASDLKIIVILRNPAERAFSHYTHLIRNGIEKLEFSEAITPQNIEQRSKEMWGFDYTGYGLYGAQMEVFKNFFKHILVLDYEELAEPNQMMEKIYTFLDIKNPVKVDEKIEANPSGVPKSKFVTALIRSKRFKKIIKQITPSKALPIFQKMKDSLLKKSIVKPKISEQDNHYLREFFRKDIEKLERILNKNFNSWK